MHGALGEKKGDDPPRPKWIRHYVNGTNKNLCFNVYTKYIAWQKQKNKNKIEKRTSAARVSFSKLFIPL
jgi:hypothetical protein